MQILVETFCQFECSSVEDKNRRRVDVCSEREKERDRKLSPLPSLLPTLSSLLHSSAAATGGLSRGNDPRSDVPQ